VDRQGATRRSALFDVTPATKQKDAAGLGALAYAYREGDQSTLDCVPDQRLLKIVSEALVRPQAFFEWVCSVSKSQGATDIIHSARRYLTAATWEWDKACILAGALLATLAELPTIEHGGMPLEEFPYWVALDKHTPEGKAVLSDVAKEIKSSYRRLIWANFYCESARVNRLLFSPWWDAERTWRLRRAGLSWDEAEELWSRAAPLIRQRLEEKAAALRKLVDVVAPQSARPDLLLAGSVS
jgi:hypothetical protein